MSIYTDSGYKDRDEYRNKLADIYKIDREAVDFTADMCGDEYAFDMLPEVLYDVYVYGASE